MNGALSARSDVGSPLERNGLEDLSDRLTVRRDGEKKVSVEFDGRRRGGRKATHGRSKVEMHDESCS